MSDVPGHAQEITPEWLTAALKERALLKGSVSSVDSVRIGEGIGLMAELARLHIEYEGEEDLPRTMVAKTAARNENRAVAQLLDFYNRETRFYNHIGQDCPFRVPTSYYGAVDPETYDFVLLLEDLGEVSPDDQIIGSSETEAYEKAGSIAKLHAMLWDKVDADEHDWMYDIHCPAELEKLRDYVYMPALEPCLDKFEHLLNDSSRSICRRVGEQYVELMEGLSPDYTFLHGDFRQDNFIRPATDGSVVMDWQISGKGYPIFDLTYFMCQSLQVELRREIERELLMHYLETLSAAGVTSYDMKDAWHDYRLMTLFCLIYPVTVCGSLDLGNERGRSLAETMFRRNLEVIDDLDCDEFLN